MLARCACTAPRCLPMPIVIILKSPDSTVPVKPVWGLTRLMTASQSASAAWAARHAGRPGGERDRGKGLADGRLHVGQRRPGEALLDAHHPREARRAGNAGEPHWSPSSRILRHDPSDGLAESVMPSPPALHSPQSGTGTGIRGARDAPGAVRPRVVSPRGPVAVSFWGGRPRPGG